MQKCKKKYQGNPWYFFLLDATFLRQTESASWWSKLCRTKKLHGDAKRVRRKVHRGATKASDEKCIVVQRKRPTKSASWCNESVRRKIQPPRRNLGGKILYYIFFRSCCFRLPSKSLSSASALRRCSRPSA